LKAGFFFFKRKQTENKIRKEKTKQMENKIRKGGK